MTSRFTCMLLATMVLAGTFAGCGEEPPPPPPPTATYPITVTVKSPDGVPVPKAPVLFGEKVVGFTDANGTFDAELTRQSGQDFTISVGAVEGFRYLNETTVTETLRTVESVDGGRTGVPLALDVQAQSLRNDYFFWVRTNCDDNLPDGSCEGLEVKLNDEVVATTNDLGYAQFMISEVPETEVELVIDTPNYDPNADDAVGMEPRDPEYKVLLDLEPQVYLIEEGFVDALAKKKPKKRRRTYRRKKRRSKPKVTKPKKSEIKEGDDGVIDLF